MNNISYIILKELPEHLDALGRWVNVDLLDRLDKEVYKVQLDQEEFQVLLVKLVNQVKKELRGRLGQEDQLVRENKRLYFPHRQFYM